MFIEALGWAAAAFGSLVALPQVVRLFQTGSAAGVSLTAWQASFGANIAWTVHGVLGGYANLWVPNVIFFCCSTLILLQMQRDRRLNWWWLLLPGLALGGATVALDLLAGPVAFAIAALLPALLAQVAQLHALFIKPNIGGVSLPYMAMNVLNQLIWVTWAAFAGESSVIMVGSTLGVLMVANLIGPCSAASRWYAPGCPSCTRERTGSLRGWRAGERSVPGLQLLLDLAVEPGDPAPQRLQVAGPAHLPLGVGEDPVRGSGQDAQAGRSRRAAPR